ncbi:MAG: dTMP kinase [Chloroflexota bacterium]
MGFFITFEGPEGCGKSTQAELLYRKLLGLGYPILLTREPGGTAISDEIRRVILDPKNTAMLPLTEILLFAASRAQHVGQVIAPHLAKGGIVISDRYADSTMAYQGYGLGIELKMLETITGYATGGLVPDLTFYLDIPVEVGLRRRLKLQALAPGQTNRLDLKELEYHRRVRDGYLKMIAQEPRRWVVIDGLRTVAEIQADIWNAAEARLGQAADHRVALSLPGS